MVVRKLATERRADVIRAAAEVLVERGLSETRTSDIAERAGMSPGHVMYHFGSKAEILRQALDQLEEDDHLRVSRELPKVTEPWARLERFFELTAPHSRKDPLWRLWVELWDAALREPESASAGRRLSLRWVDTAAGVIRYGQDLDAFQPVETNAVARLLLAVLDGTTMQFLMRFPATPKAQVTAACMRVAHQELDHRS